MNAEITKIIKNNDYLGWIPCVIGRLDFSKVCIKQLSCIEKKKHQKAFCFSYQDKHSLPNSNFIPRFNIVSSVQNWKDRNDPNNLYDGLFRFITFSKTTVTGSMHGTAFLLLDLDVVKSESFVADVLAPLEKLEQNVQRYDKAIAENQYTPSFILEQHNVDEEVKRIESVITQFSSQDLKDRIIVIEYTILSNGLTFIKPVLRKGLHEDENIQQAIEHSNFIASKQCFIYIKHSLHTHKHHNKNEDRLTIIHPINKDNIEETALRLISDMERSIIEIKELGVHKIDASQYYLQGFISYSKSLVESLLENSLINRDKGKIKIKFLDNMLQSWRSLILKHEREEDQLSARKAKNASAIGELFQSLSLFVTLFAFLFSTARWFIPTGETIQSAYGKDYEFLSVFFDDPMKTSIILVLCVFACLVLRVMYHPNGIVRRPLVWLLKLITKNAILQFLRCILIALFIFFIGRLLAGS